MNHIFKVLFSFCCLLCSVCIPCYLKAQSGTFTDPRDSMVYQIVTVGNTQWFTENLKFETESSHCPNHSTQECNRGNFYSFEEAPYVCPEGWRLPSVSDWNSYFELISDSVKFERYEFKKSFRIIFSDMKVYELAHLNLELYGRVEGHTFYKGDYVDYWTTSEELGDLKFHIHITPKSIGGHAHKHHIESKEEKKRKFPVRCVCELKDTK